MGKIGLKIKKRRMENGMLLKDLAEKTGLTPSFLSQLENGMTSPSVDSLRKIAEALSTTVGWFFQESPSTELVFLRKKLDSKVFGTDPVPNYELLASSILDIKIVPMLLKLKKHETLNLELCPQGEEMLGVALEGKIAIGVNGKEFNLEALDTIYLVRPQFNYLKNNGEEKLVFLWNVLRK